MVPLYRCSIQISFSRRVTALAALVKADPGAVTLKDDQDCTVLHWACYNGNSNCVEYLLEQNVIDSLEGKYFLSSCEFIYSNCKFHLLFSFILR